MEEALELRPKGRPDRAISLISLAIAIRKRFKKTGDRQDLERPVGWLEEALELCPQGHPLRADTLFNLANAISTQFKKLAVAGIWVELWECTSRH